MNKKFTYFILLAIFFSATAFIITRYQHKKSSSKISFYELKDRNGALALAPEWSKTKNTARNLFKAVAEDPNDIKSSLGLATIFLKEARITGDYSYYDMAAMQQVEKVLIVDPANFEALTYKALIYLSQHHFAEGLEIAEQAQKLNPYNPLIYGIMVDANVEIGNYNAAVSNSDKMVSLRPDIRSYSRISYLREIHGDYPGAIEAMELAVEAGFPGEDASEWARVQLGHLYEMTGKTDSANHQYAQSLIFRKGFAPAIAGLGRIAMTLKNYNKAEAFYSEADSLISDYGLKQELGRIYELKGDKKKADSIFSWVIEAMGSEATEADNDESIGHYVDNELAHAYLTVGNNEKALEHALAEYNRRPQNIDVNETVAWVYYKKDDFTKAVSYMDTALKTNSKNPVLLCRAGLIYAKSGNRVKGKQFLVDALKNNSGIDLELKKESEELLATL